jgi:hypothetical protein
MKLQNARGAASSVLACGLLSLLSACGGGGSSSPSPAPMPGGSAVVSGTATYQSVPAAANGGLNYGAASFKPIRGATVQLLDVNGAVLASGATDGLGHYSIALPVAQQITVRVRAELAASPAADGPGFNFSVRDNTQGNALYVLDSAPFVATGGVARDLQAASGWGGSSYTAVRSAGPFSILDVVYAGTQKVLSVVPNLVLPTLQLYWSANNRPASGDPTQGFIGTSFFTSNAGAGQPGLFLLGAADVDTDEYDTHVVEHEFGHYLQYALSRDDSPGGPHSSGDKLDARLAFSEGWGNAWSGMALGGPLYSDSDGPRQASGFVLDVSRAPVGSDQGAYSETTLQYLLWTASQDPAIGFTPIYNAFVALKPLPAFTTAYAMSRMIKTVSPASSTEVDALWNSVGVHGTDEYGSGETNDGGITGTAATLPVYKTHPGIGGTATYCLTSHYNVGQFAYKLGTTQFIRFDVPAAGTHTLSVTRNAQTTDTAATDPDFILLRSDGTRTVADTNSLNPDGSPSNAETLASTSLSAGATVIALSDFNMPVKSTAASPDTQRCFDLKVN